MSEREPRRRLVVEVVREAGEDVLAEVVLRVVGQLLWQAVLLPCRVVGAALEGVLDGL